MIAQCGRFTQELIDRISLSIRFYSYFLCINCAINIHSATLLRCMGLIVFIYFSQYLRFFFFSLSNDQTSLRAELLLLAVVKLVVPFF